MRAFGVFGSSVLRVRDGISSVLPCKLAGVDIVKCHVRAKPDAGAGIVSSHHAGAVIADGVEALDHRTIVTQHFANRRGAQAVSFPIMA